MSEFPWDSAIIATAVSIAVSITVLVIREKRIEPQKWKRDEKAKTLLKQIEAYGELLNFLNAAEARRKAWNPKGFVAQVTEQDTHLFLLPKHEIQFNEIFRKNMAFFSNELIQLHISLIESDSSYDLAEKRWKENQSSWYQGFNLSKIHNLVRNQFNAIRKLYEDMTDFKFDTNN